jgi:aryl-alcohol dehydrogenase-like predicted oxidoreductase
MKKKKISRRKFIEKSALVSSAAIMSCNVANKILSPEKEDDNSPRITVGDTDPQLDQPVSTRRAATAMATRELGNTGMEVSVLGFGGGSQFLANADGEWEPLLERALELGINYFDNCSDYGTEERYGEILPLHRDQIYIASKFNGRAEITAGPRSADEMMIEFESSLTKMKTDYLDVYMLHSLETEENDDLTHIEENIWPQMQRLKDEGSVKFIGFSSMNAVQGSMDFIERMEPDVVLLAMNATQYGNFAQYALPPAVERNIGVLAMKVMRDLVGQNGATAEELLAYALTQDGVSCALVGHVGMEVLEENASIANAYTTTTSINRVAVESKVQHLAGPHALCWAKTGYRDGMM